jgi:hypothetical protein
MKRRNISDMRKRFPLICLSIITLFLPASLKGQEKGGEAESKWEVKRLENSFHIQAGILQRQINLEDENFYTASMLVGSHEILTQPHPEVSLRLSRTKDNEKPSLISEFVEAQATESTATFGSTDRLIVKESLLSNKTDWVESLSINSLDWGAQFDKINSLISTPRKGVTRLTIRVRSIHKENLKDLAISLVYEIYDGHPATRQWVEVVNNSSLWYRLDQLTISALPIGNKLNNIGALTPDDEAVSASIRSFASGDGSYGLILGSEVPSATRRFDVKTGTLGYADDYFEWILEPGGRFISEAVSYHAFEGEKEKTISSVSTPLDRCVEGQYKKFLDQCLGIMINQSDISAPRYCTWSNYGQFITEEIARQIIPIAARCGFETFQIDDGWQYDRLGTEPNIEKFPNFDYMAKLVADEGMTLGLWVSCYRSKDAKDLRVLPNALSLPPIKRLDGYGVSFASDWRYYYVQDLVYLHDRFGAKYFKQDFTNIRLGDMADGHESHSRKESYLRGLRGLLESQALVHEMSPDITTLISHEIYWGTPGVPCDLAVMKNVSFYHIPPNDYSGLGPLKYRKKLVSEYDSLANREQVQKDLILGCWNARRRYYAHRGLPMHMLEYYGAASANVQKALTISIQDRQICSFLMGAPVVYAGDLLSLSEENIQHYRKRFDQLRSLQNEFDIYKYFQYSGVPEPTDEDWHWWGKLNENNEGIVVILRGSQGDDERLINIPWVDSESRYTIQQLFTEKNLGTFSGKELKDGIIKLSLPVYGQEILLLKVLE